MAVWLRPDTAGFTLKDFYADAATHAFQLRNEVRQHWHPTPDQSVGNAVSLGDRRRRPVGVLLAEISNCLRTAADLLEEAPDDAPVPHTIHDLVNRIGEFLATPTAPQPPTG